MLISEKDHMSKKKNINYTPVTLDMLKTAGLLPGTIIKKAWGTAAGTYAYVKGLEHNTISIIIMPAHDCTSFNIRSNAWTKSYTIESLLRWWKIVKMNNNIEKPAE